MWVASVRYVNGKEVSESGDNPAELSKWAFGLLVQSIERDYVAIALVTVVDCDSGAHYEPPIKEDDNG